MVSIVAVDVPGIAVARVASVQGVQLNAPEINVAWPRLASALHNHVTGPNVVRVAPVRIVGKVALDSNVRPVVLVPTAE
jgi:hypothetical protein